ncbi:STAS domain-containing protein [Streptomyces sp. NPDC006632]|uniref:STAS domain-containing protein n=1 Tax=Streptomyces sp. NPDC006632 TaxID=3157182 RepID=UPI0033B188BE
MRADTSGFGLWDRAVEAATVLELYGEIDIEARTALGPTVEKLIDREAPQVVVDLRPVTFLDPDGLRLLSAVPVGIVPETGREFAPENIEYVPRCLARVLVPRPTLSHSA